MMGQLLGFIPWDDSRGFWDNVAGGIADNTVAKIPGWGWDGNKGFVANVAGGSVDLVLGVAKEVARNPVDALKKYWFVPVIIGGAVVGYYVIKKTPQAQLMHGLSALSKLQIPQLQE